MNRLFWIALVLVLSGCTHSINFRASHFAVPVTADKQWSGNVSLAITGTTRITLINDTTTNPPTRNDVGVNSEIGAEDLFFANNIGIDASLSVLNSLDVYLDNSLWGLRWQFLNHGNTGSAWVGALQAAYGQRTDTSDMTGTQNGEIHTESKVKTGQAGVSFGYRMSQVVPYLSYIYENHQVSTNVTSGAGSFGPYDDKGIHQYASIGLTSASQGFSYAIEYNIIQINWDRAERASQNAAGARIGYSW